MKKKVWGRERMEELFRRACLDYRGAVTVDGHYHPHLIMTDVLTNIVLSLYIYGGENCGTIEAYHIEESGTWKAIDISFIFDDEKSEEEVLNYFLAKHLVKDDEGVLC